MANTFRYADKNEQLIRANRFLSFGYLVYFTELTVIMIIFYLLGVRSAGLTVIMTALNVISAVVLLVLGRSTNPKTLKNLKFIAIPFTSAVGFFSGFAFTEGFVQLLPLFPLIGCILFFDVNYMKIASIVYGIVQICVCAFKIITRQNLEGGDIIAEIFVTVVFFTLLTLINIVTKVGAIFNNDAVGQANEEKEHIQKVMDDVMNVAAEVRKGTETAMEIVDALNTSTEVVNGAMKDISDSTLSTAENIQVQTSMTSNIQEAIHNTIQSSENMVAVAKHSGDLNNRSLDLMNQLKEQSSVISGTNSEVDSAMQALRERTEAVKSIADTILSISNQTNLLALNASIESARAGEAGRGFAVVADEIRQLAEKTRLETEGITRISDELTTNAEKAGQAVKKSVEAAKAQDEMIATASECFEEMNSNMGNLLDEIQGIDTMLNNLSTANDQIVDNIMNLSATTEEVTASSAQAADLSMENLTNSENAKRTLQSVMEVSHEFDKYL